MKILALAGFILTICLSGHAQSVPQIYHPPESVKILKQRALRIATQLAEAVRTQEPKWKLEEGGIEGPMGFGPDGPRRLEYFKQQNWRAGENEIEVRIRVFEFSEDASAA